MISFHLKQQKGKEEIKTNDIKQELFTKRNHVFSLDRHPRDHLFASVTLVTFPLFNMLRK